MAPETTHASFLARLADGEDHPAWQEFCDRYGQLIHNFARREGLQQTDCDDVLQEVLLSLTESMPRFRYDRAKGRFRSYLKRVALRAIYRRKSRRDSSPERVQSVTNSIVAIDDEQVWEEEWRKYHLRWAMRRIEAEFNELDRSAFQLYAAQGLRPIVAAKTSGISVDQVYQAKSRILKRLTQIIAEQVADEG